MCSIHIKIYIYDFKLIILFYNIIIMSSYNKYMKIKKVINKSRIYGGNESLKHIVMD